MKNRCVIIGAGAAVEHLYRHAVRDSVKLGWLDVVAIIDPNPLRRAKAASWFPGARSYEYLDHCFAQETDLDFAVVVSPPPHHIEHVITALEKGCHVFCEKPFAHSLAAAEQMVSSAEAHGRLLAVGMTRRLYPSIAAAWETIVNRGLGSILRFVCREGSVYSWPVASPAPFRRESSGGGVLLDAGIHALDMLTSLFGGGSVLRYQDDAFTDGVEANAILYLQMERASGTLQLSWDMILNNGLHVIGEKGEMWLPTGSVNVLFHRKCSPGAPWKKVSAERRWPRELLRDNSKFGFPQSHTQCFYYQLVQVMRAIRWGEPPPCSGMEALMSMQLIQSCYNKATPLQKPWLSGSEQSRYDQQHWKHQFVEG